LYLLCAQRRESKYFEKPVHNNISVGAFAALGKHLSESGQGAWWLGIPTGLHWWIDVVEPAAIQSNTRPFLKTHWRKNGNTAAPGTEFPIGCRHFVYKNSNRICLPTRTDVFRLKLDKYVENETASCLSVFRWGL